MRWRWNVRRNQRKVHLWSSFETRRNLQAEARYGDAFQQLFRERLSEKVMGQSRKILWVVLRSLKFLKDIWENVTRDNRSMLESAKGKRYSVRNMSHIAFRDCRVHIFFRQPSRNTRILPKGKVINMRYWPSSFDQDDWILAKFFFLMLLGSFSNDDGDGSENFKKAIGLLSKTTSTCITLFCTFLYRLCKTTTWKCLISRFMEDVNKRRRIFLSLSKL